VAKIPFNLNSIRLTKLDDYLIKKNSDNQNKIYPFLIEKNSKSRNCGYIVSSFHGRSIIVDYNNKEDKYIILKGCGLTYTSNNFINCNEYKDYGHLWGYLDYESANRDFTIGNYCKTIGINTGDYQYVIKLNHKISASKLRNLYPYLLQYSVKCPFRLYDLPLIDKTFAYKHLDVVKKSKLTYYESFAKILFNQLLILHNNNVFYNGINPMNISAQCELLDWESSRTDTMPYRDSFEKEYHKLLGREILNIFNVCYFISIFTKEKYSPQKIEKIKNKEYVSKIKNVYLKRNLSLLKEIR
jgi:hypothetical protein